MREHAVQLLSLVAPFLVIAGVFALMLRANRRVYQKLNETNQVIHREMVQHLDRIATALEKRS